MFKSPHVISSKSTLLVFIPDERWAIFDLNDKLPVLNVIENLSF